MVVARNDAAHLALAAQFEDHSIERVYRAFVRALPRESGGRIDRAIGRHPRDRKKMSVRTRRGRAAITNWCVEEKFPASGISLLAVRPETGRTHQIRVHLSASGMPIAGDPVYGKSSKRNAVAGGGARLERPALHAAVLGFHHPTSHARLRFEAALPDDLSQLLDWLRGREPGAEA
jgi:23S rRNA pseudouridine1911/1915/1917 synthase